MTDALTDHLRILTKTIPGIVSVDEDGIKSLETTVEGWEILDVGLMSSSVQALVWRGYIDLAGYDAEQLTLFIQGINVQEPYTVSGLPLFISQIDLVTKVYLNDADLLLSVYPGFPESNKDMEQVLMGQHRAFFHDTAWTGDTLQQLAHLNQWGEGAATANARLYITRIVLASGGGGERVFFVPPACYQVAAVAMEEPDLEYVMRLRRDYELASKE